MVQVDVFWSYGLGAGMALAAGRQLRARREIARAEREGGVEPERRLPGDPADRSSLRRNPYFLVAVLYAAVLFAPSGAYLLWEFPDWETMHAGDRGLPAWLVVLFAITNVTQAMLGFAVVEHLLTRGRAYLAWLQLPLAYLGMFFVLVHGWDGEGWKRFFSPNEADYRAWDGDWSAWLTSDVAVTLYVMGVLLIPVLLAIVGLWTARGNELAAEGERRPSATTAVAVHLTTVFGIGLGLAVASSLLIHSLGTGAGVVAAAALAALVLMPGGPAYRLYALLGLGRARDSKPLATPIGRRRLDLT